MLNQLQRVEELGEANLKKDVIKHYSCLANKIFKDKLAQAQQLEAKIEEKREITPNLRKR